MTDAARSGEKAEGRTTTNDDNDNRIMPSCGGGGGKGTFDATAVRVRDGMEVAIFPKTRYCRLGIDPPLLLARFLKNRNGELNRDSSDLEPRHVA